MQSLITLLQGRLLFTVLLSLALLRADAGAAAVRSLSVDTIAPTVRITAPVYGSEVRGTVPVVASVTDNVGVRRVEFSVNGVIKATTSVAPYTFNWDTTAHADGPYSVRAKAYDARGNLGQYAATFYVKNVIPDTIAPTVRITAPVYGSEVRGTVPVVASATDNVGVRRVEFSVNGVIKATTSVAPYTLNWDTTAHADGPYSVRAKAYDAQGNLGQYAATFYVKNAIVKEPVPNTPPVITSFTMPATSPSRTVPVLSFAATDDMQQLKYRITENSVAPDPISPGWLSERPTSFTFSGDGVRTAYAWVLDAGASLSLSKSAVVNIVPPDTIAPTITSFAMPDSASSLTVPVTAFVASDNVGVTGYSITESTAAPLASAIGWAESAPGSFTFSSAGTRTIYAWTKDGAGNISASRSAVVTIIIPDPVSEAAVLYHTGFEDVQDWIQNRPAKGASGYSFPSTWSGQNNGNPLYPPPRKTDGTFLFDTFRVAPTLFDPPNVKNMVEIKNGYGRNGGRGLLYNVEVSGVYGVWTGGNPMNVWLGGTQANPKSYKELYLRFYLKYPLQWVWTNDSNPIDNRGAMQKVMKIVRYNGYLGDGGNPQLYVAPSGGGRNHPLWSMQWHQYISTTPSSTIFNNVERLSPNYTSGGIQISRNYGWPADGEWHCYDYHVKMNTIPGLPDGGLEEVWLDGVLKHRKENVIFVNTAGSTELGWNHVEILDNVTLASYPLSSQVTLPLYLDDVVISKDYRGPPAAPANVTARQTSSSTVTVQWQAGNNGAIFLLSGYRIHYGTNPANLTNMVQVNSGTVKEISGLQRGQTYYFAVSAFNQFPGEPNENRSIKSTATPVNVSY